MGAAIDLSGQRFGRLIVISRAENGKEWKARWNCSCDCGTQVTVEALNLRQGHTKSCGCLRSEFRRLELGEASFRQFYRHARRAAEKRNYNWELTPEIVRGLTKMPCHYCGVPPQNVVSAEDRYGSYTYNGLDRVNNNLGYSTNNVVACCEQCNRAKLTYTKEEFREWLHRAYHHSFD